jgi:hypothetical protein
MLFDLIFLGYEVVWEETVNMYKRINRTLLHSYPDFKHNKFFLHLLTFLLLYPCGVGHYFFLEGQFLGSVPGFSEFSFSYYNMLLIPLTSFCATYILFHAMQGRLYM